LTDPTLDLVDPENAELRTHVDWFVNLNLGTLWSRLWAKDEI
jgi:hypothetical protein